MRSMCDRQAGSAKNICLQRTTHTIRKGNSLDVEVSHAKDGKRGSRKEGKLSLSSGHADQLCLLKRKGNH